jgi:hypothetical protein
MVVMAFLQYKTEAIPGKPLKRKVTQEETRERKKQYEKDREKYHDHCSHTKYFTTSKYYDNNCCK